MLTMELFFFFEIRNFAKEWHHQWRFFKLASIKSVKTACVCIAFFFHYFKYYGQKFFSRITVLYLIAKVERKNKLFNLKHEIILCQKEKRSKMFQVKVISKDVRKTIVPSFMSFFFNLSKSVCHPLCKGNVNNTIFTTEPIK